MATTIEMCAGAGGQALGLHRAGFEHNLLIEIDSHACETLRRNNTSLQLGWQNIIEGDLREFVNESRQYQNRIDLVAGGVPCPPFSKAGLQLGRDDERDLFPTALDIVSRVQPHAVMLENVQGLLESRFDDYRREISQRLSKLGYVTDWKLLQASDFGVPQLRPRVILVAMREPAFMHFTWPNPVPRKVTVGEALLDLMESNGWEGALEWAERANDIAPTLVGGSKKHGGPDLGPTRAKQQWKQLGVNAHRVGNDDELPDADFRGVLLKNGKIREGFEGMPLLTTRMAARIQGFPDEWQFYGSKTHAYRQVGNAFPPPVAEAVGIQIHLALAEAGLVERQVEEGAAA
ncbi:DNA cytosine methyltransferase [Aliiglaciecola sp. CAU 1673]|uniref:DNA cytosine methyltransferase n=1 Tax=Aliiglaciecola sp. CAU 1673 TaxID=3032595 RepID=UPI0023DB31A3|nr:DNA cytosine methyltransferase [Aliiglaciecola sp. CAU 1673]MDF2179098.1 DNA cytosine methyltransferase [Aliiglaciecola sp. CAU 1673]